MKNVDDMYPLSPMQEFMLLHAVAHSANDVLFNQFCYALDGDLDAARYIEAWRAVTHRHAALRTAFLYKKLRRPVQVVRSKIVLPVTELDWRDVSEREQQERFARFRQQDRATPFDPASAPLMRIALIRRDAGRWWLVWSSHHLIVDRWCLGTLFEQIGQLYESRHAVMAPAPQYRDYIGWLNRQDAAASERYWQGVLAGLDRVVTVTRQDQTETAARMATISIDGDELERARQAARSRSVSLNTLVQAAWALVVNRLSASSDIVFGATVAGRPPDLEGVETIVGTFVNNLPVRVRLAPDATVLELLASLQQTQHQRLAYEHVSPAALADWQATSGDSRLFDTLIVGLGGLAQSAPDGVTMMGVSRDLATAFPLTLSTNDDGNTVQIDAVVAAGYAAVREPAELLGMLATSISALCDSKSATQLHALAGFEIDRRPRAKPATPATFRRAVKGAGQDAGDLAMHGRAGINDTLIRDLVQALWQQILGNAADCGDRDFFDLGGNSLQAARLHAGVEASLRKSVPMLALFQAPTIDGMVQTLADETWPMKADICVAIRSHGNLPALFCIASPEVNTVGYALLARHLNPQRPVHVLQAPPAVGQIRRLTPGEIPAVASDYIEAMRIVQPDGPYLLLGMCTGSHIAVDMARQMQASGHAPAFVGIVNTWGHYTVARRYLLQKVVNRLRYYRRRVGQLLNETPTSRAEALRRIATRRITTVRQVAVTAATRAKQVPQTDQGSAWIDEMGWARLDPGGPKYPGLVTVFRIRRQPWWRIRDKGLGWRRAAEQIQVEWLAGDDHHAIMRQPRVAELAARMEANIAQPENRPTAPGTVSPLGNPPDKRPAF